MGEELYEGIGEAMGRKERERGSVKDGETVRRLGRGGKEKGRGARRGGKLKRGEVARTDVYANTRAGFELKQT